VDQVPKDVKRLAGAVARLAGRGQTVREDPG
jgi:hypothetical protein